MCRGCAVKRVAELLQAEESAGLARVGSRGQQVAVCVVEHGDHSHLRFRSSDGASEWYYMPWPLSILRSALPDEHFAVHVHGDREDLGLDDDAAEALQQASSAFAGLGLSDTCAICMDTVNVVGGPEGEKAMTLPCGHSFHESCASRWLKTNRHCPNCRFELTIEAIASARDRAEEYSLTGASRPGGWAQFLRTATAVYGDPGPRSREPRGRPAARGAL